MLNVVTNQANWEKDHLQKAQDGGLAISTEIPPLNPLSWLYQSDGAPEEAQNMTPGCESI
jgi:hypothetical protein